MNNVSDAHIQKRVKIEAILLGAMSILMLALVFVLYGNVPNEWRLDLAGFIDIAGAVLLFFLAKTDGIQKKVREISNLAAIGMLAFGVVLIFSDQF